MTILHDQSQVRQLDPAAELRDILTRWRSTTVAVVTRSEVTSAAAAIRPDAACRVLIVARLAAVSLAGLYDLDPDAARVFLPDLIAAAAVTACNGKSDVFTRQVSRISFFVSQPKVAARLGRQERRVLIDTEPELVALHGDGTAEYSDGTIRAPDGKRVA